MTPEDWLRGDTVNNFFKRMPIRTEPVSSGVAFTSVPGHVQVVLVNEDGDTMELPEGGHVLAYLSATAARSLRDELLDPDEFPESVG